MINFLLKKFIENKDQDGIIWRDRAYSYDWLFQRISSWREIIKSHQIKTGTITILEADFSPNSIALFLALIEHSCIIVPLTSSVEAKKQEFIETAQGEVSFIIDDNDSDKILRLSNVADHEYYQKLRTLNHPGLVLFSSGSTGKSKAAVHDLTKLLEKFKVPRHGLRTITFLLFDHIGGVNTMFYTLSNGGCLITVQDRSPDGVLKTIEKFKVELLPTSPTFINLIIISKAYKRYDLNSLITITYGTEPMPDITLKKIHEIFPNVRLQQTYGLSELGILRSKSKNSDSLWVKIGGEGFEIKIVDGILWIRAESAMLGYLNAPSPFDEDGWFNTGDIVQADGDFIRILGRKSEIINVGGEKVYPVEVENIIQTMEGVEHVIVKGESNPITGQIVVARIKLKTNETVSEFKKRMFAFCRDKLPNYKIPQKVILDSTEIYGERFKKIRQG